MSVTIKSSRMKYKDSNGNYVGVDVIADKTTAEQIADIQSAGTAAQGEITTLTETKKTEITNKGNQTIASIPQDYTSLANDVVSLSSALNGLASEFEAPLFQTTASGTGTKTYYPGVFPKGKYKMNIASVSSTDTDKNVSSIRFYTLAGSSELIRLDFNRTVQPQEQVFNLSEDCNRIVFYAGTTGVNSSGDSFEFKNCVVYLTNLKDKLDEKATKTELDGFANNFELVKFSDTVSGTKQKLFTSILFPKGKYKFTVGNVTSSDTDKTQCNVNFYGVSTGTENAHIVFDRVQNQEKYFELTEDCRTLNFYASTTSALSEGDTFEFTNAVISLITAKEQTEETISELASKHTKFMLDLSSITGTQIVRMYNLNLKKGTYDLFAENVSSSDTDAEICSIVFRKNGIEVGNAQFKRTQDQTVKAFISDDCDQIDFLASRTSALAAGDTFTFTNFSATLTSLRNIIDKSINDQYNVFNQNKYTAHLWVNESTNSNTSDFYIPSQSIFDLEMTARLGFKVVEGNVHATATPGKYVVMHGNQGKLGPEVVAITDGYSNESYFTDLTFDEIRNNFVYRNTYEKYRTPITSLEEFCYTCKQLGLIPLLTYIDTTEWSIIKSICGENVIQYGNNRENFAGILSEYLSYATKAEIIARCKKFGPPYSYSMANVTSFTDSELEDIVQTIHREGYVCSVAGAYLDPNNERKYLAMGFDSSGSGWSVEEFETGNVLDLSGDLDFGDFETNGTTENGVLTLTNGQYIRISNTSTKFLQKCSLHVMFDGTISLTMGKYINNVSVTSDGVEDVHFSSILLNRSGDFVIVANGTVQIKSITYKLSKC